jgi:hypothetical protein
MPSSYTPLLGFVQPTTGELTNQWGTVVNNQLTQLVEDSIAKTSSFDVSLSNWILSTGPGVPNQARNAVLIATGSPGATRYIIAPKQSKAYIVINDCQDGSTIYLCGGPTDQTPGVFILAGQSALCAWDSTVYISPTVSGDFVKVAGGSGGATGGGTNQIFFENGQTVTVSYSITAGKNAGTFGPVTINSGITVTVPTGSVWTVV